MSCHSCRVIMLQCPPVSSFQRGVFKGKHLMCFKKTLPRSRPRFRPWRLTGWSLGLYKLLLRTLHKCTCSILLKVYLTYMYLLICCTQTCMLDGCTYTKCTCSYIHSSYVTLISCKQVCLSTSCLICWLIEGFATLTTARSLPRVICR